VVGKQKVEPNPGCSHLGECIIANALFELRSLRKCGMGIRLLTV